MIFPRPSLLALLPLACYFGVKSVLAEVYITNPVASSSVTGGQSLTVSWIDDGSTPVLSTIGPSRIDVYTGSTTQQTLLQSIAMNVDVSKVNSVTGLLPASLGPDGDWYFVRVTSNSFMDPKNPQYPYEAFSAKFSMNGMSGQFNASVSSQNAAAASTGYGGSSAPASATATLNGAGKASTNAGLAASTTTGSAMSTMTRSTSVSATGSVPSASASGSNKTSGATRGAGKGLMASGLFVTIFSVGLAFVL